ncbi:hypothetical protein VTJ83DRAFT_6137 [Remersonia thermophila]|uniref:Biotin synthase-like protein n=1 Tax=Remersonia thermophila TaxID=72144 RepID=A0ABR4D8T8_9PEZI
MACLAPGGRRFFSRPTLFLALAICLVWFLGVQFSADVSRQWSNLGAKLGSEPGSSGPASDPAPEPTRPPPGPSLPPPPERIPTVNVLPPLKGRRVLCRGPRGHLLGESPEDDLVERELESPYPQPWAGNYDEIGLNLTVMSVKRRYAPYGYGEDRDDYNRQKVDWDAVDWGQLQNDCFQRNRHRFPASAVPFNDTRSVPPRFAYRGGATVPEVRHWHEFEPSRRTALVVRTWRGYQYLPEDMYYLRSLVAEAALKFGGEYQVILLVDMKDTEGYDNDIFASSEAYRQGLDDAGVPPEFRSIALLWSTKLLESWYPKVGEHRTMYQVFQPMQLLALHYPEFDHFWQLEMDMRFLGDAGKFLDQLGSAARSEPRKQALERSSFWHMMAETGDYGEFFRAVNASNNGSSHVWGPLRVPEIPPIGPDPPVADPHQDDFAWGVGEEADVITTSYCMNALNPSQWMFRDWIGGLAAGTDTPRWYCPPAIMRGSRALLLAIHHAQLELGIRVPSEATLPSFALWHGLKLSFPQHPVYHRDKDDVSNRRAWWRGGPRASSTGLGPDSMDHPRGLGLTFWWESEWAKEVFYEWFGKKMDAKAPRAWILGDWDGELWAPNMMLHQVKHFVPPAEEEKKQAA